MQKFVFLYSQKSEIAFFDSKNLPWELLCFPYLNYKEIYRWKDFKSRIKESCVYLIIGSKNENSPFNIYVGKSERSFEQRLNEHERSKFNKFEIKKIFVFTSNKLFKSMDNLCDFETKFINYISQKLQNYNLFNKNNGSQFKKRRFEESANAYDSNQETFLQMWNLFLFLLKTENNNLNQSSNEGKNNIKKKNSIKKIFYLKDSKKPKRYAANGYIKKNEEFVVLKNSKAVNQPYVKNQNILKNWKTIEKKLLEKKVIFWTNDFYIFREKYSFNSCSSAGVFIKGNSSNGWTDWKETNTSKNLDQVYRVKNPMNPKKRIFKKIS